MSEEKPTRFRRRPTGEPYFDFHFGVTIEETDSGRVVVLELADREDDDDRTRLGLEPHKATALGTALVNKAREASDRS